MMTPSAVLEEEDRRLVTLDKKTHGDAVVV